MGLGSDEVFGWFASYFTETTRLGRIYGIGPTPMWADHAKGSAHCLRHTMRDRLRAVECPSDMIDQIGGWRSVGGVGVSYGRGYSLEQLRDWVTKIKV